MRARPAISLTELSDCTPVTYSHPLTPNNATFTGHVQSLLTPVILTSKPQRFLTAK